MRNVSYTLESLADHIDAEWVGDPACTVSSVSAIQSAQPGQLCYVRSEKYESLLEESKASIVIMTPESAASYPCNAILVKNPELAFARLAILFKMPLTVSDGIHPTAIIGSGCDIAEGVSIGANCVIGDLVEIAAGTVIQPSSVVGDRVRIGANCTLHSRVTLYADVVLKNHVVLHSGAVIGADGFGLTKDEQGSWVSMPQLGSVILHDHVEVGANTCIDRGAIEDTVLEQGVRLDNQIQIGHNVRVGANTAIAACTGIAGSVTIGKNCVIAGAVGVSGHLTIADGVTILAMSGVQGSITEPGYYLGSPCVKSSLWKRRYSYYNQLRELFKRVKQLERQV